MATLSDLAGTEPTVITEPPHIKEWSIKRTLTGPPDVWPPELERVTLVYDNGRHTLSAVVYDREQERERMLWPPVSIT